MALALFDLDNTLIAGDSDHSWGEFLVQQNLVNSSVYKSVNDQFLKDYEAGNLDILAYLEFSLAPLIGKTPASLGSLHDKFMSEIITPLKLPKAMHLLDGHRRAGDRLIVVTSTNRFIVEPIVRSFLIGELLATDPEIINGRFTGRIQGIPTFQGGKVERVNLWLSQNNETLSGSYFYTDSINDLPLLNEVDYPIAVDPDKDLEQVAKEKRWKIISLRN